MKLIRMAVLVGPAVVTACIALAAGAQPNASPQRIIDNLDQDGDQLLSIEEFELPDRGRERGPLAAADTDGDGIVSRGELEAHLEERAADAMERFDNSDLNNDGMLTEEEIKLATFSRIDSNGDGYIDAQELAAMRKGRRPERMG